MTKKIYITLALLLLAVTVNAQTFSEQVEKDFQEKQEILPNGDLFKIFDNDLSAQEEACLKMLYAYMPIGDITDYSGEFYLENVHSTLSTAQEMKWNIPEKIFRHFVLPIRVNNENLDNSRMIFHDILKDRIKGLSMYDAVLEVNHWCHEKANYRPSDQRTSSPLATVSTAYGRCGEESTFLVAALRSVGIPARQVYTPRWAHTDDNHAWVEAWVNGKWYFLGACEPEPVLNLGWFNAPASRGMLMHTKVFGRYDGPEDIMKVTKNYTEINIISNYGDNAEITIQVVDKGGNVVPDAEVEFKLYNYAEYFTVSRKKCNAEGITTLNAGLGDMVVMAYHGHQFGIEKCSFGKDQTKTIVLNHTIGDEFSIELDIVPPTEKPNVPFVSAEQRKQNDIRFNREDSIRNAYIATFPMAEDIAQFAKANRYKVEEIEKYIVASRGNHHEIQSFLQTAAQKGVAQRALDLLSTLAEKDLRDTKADILNNHLYNTAMESDIATILAPRISYEMLTPYRKALQDFFGKEQATKFRSNPELLVDWCRRNITLHDEWSTVSTLISPIGILNSRTSDGKSLPIFFVASARSCGIPSYIDGITGNTYYIHKKDTITVDFSTGKSDITGSGFLQLKYDPIPKLNDPEYYRHYTLSKFEKGKFNLQTYPDFEKASMTFGNYTKIPEGYYQMVTGSRLANGSVLSCVNFFNIKADEKRLETLKMRDNSEAIRVIGSFNSESRFTLAETDAETSVLLTTGRGYFAVGCLGVGQEPTNHAINDIIHKAKELEKWGRKMILLFSDKAAYNKFHAQGFKGMPNNVVYGIDNLQNIQKEICKEMNLQDGTPLPIFIIADTFNRVVFESHGYTIGLGNQMMKIIDGL